MRIELTGRVQPNRLFGRDWRLTYGEHGLLLEELPPRVHIVRPHRAPRLRQLRLDAGTVYPELRGPTFVGLAGLTATPKTMDERKLAAADYLTVSRKLKATWVDIIDRHDAPRSVAPIEERTICARLVAPRGYESPVTVAGRDFSLISTWPSFYVFNHESDGGRIEHRSSAAARKLYLELRRAAHDGASFASLTCRMLQERLARISVPFVVRRYLQSPGAMAADGMLAEPLRAHEQRATESSSRAE